MPEHSSRRSARSPPIREVVLSRRAAAEVARARRWWLTHRDKAPSAFDDELEALIDRLEDSPFEIGLVVRNLPGVRRVLLRRIRYHVYFRVAESGSSVEVLALWHASRGRGPALR
jgi:plasmid stabilization system protein ParE